MNKIQLEYLKDQIKQRLSLQDIVEYYIGSSIDRNKRYKCPFNLTEQHNNFEIKGRTWRCFSCGESGDEIAFVKKLFNLSTFSECILRIARDFGLDTSEKVDEKRKLEIQKMKEEREKQKRIEEQRECFTRNILNKVLNRQYALESVMRSNYPTCMKDLNENTNKKYDWFIKAYKQYQKNSMLVDILTESETKERTDFLYGFAFTKEEKHLRKDRILDKIINRELKINEKGDVLYG